MTALFPHRRRGLDRAKTLLGGAILGLCLLTLLVAVGASVPLWGKLGVVGGLAVLAVGATIYEPMALPVLAMPILTSSFRVGGESVNLTISDFLLFALFWLCVLLGRRPYSRPMRSLLWLSALYQLATLFTVVANPYRANIVEWFHAWLSVAGALVVGWAIGRRGYARAALSLYLAACLFLGVLVLIKAATLLASGALAPVFLAWPYGMHKNFEGDVLGIAAVVAYARPPWLGWSKQFAISAFALLALATAATQARQAVVGLGVALMVLVFRRHQGVRHSKAVLLLLPIAAFVVIRAVNDQLESTNEFNSSHQRLTWFQQSLEVWDYRPVWGVGLRWWYNPWFPHNFDQVFQPPNAELEVLTSAGILGLAGFLILNIGCLGVLWRIDPIYGTLAFTAILSRFVQGQFDLYWVSVQTPIPFLIAGICVGAAATARPPERLPAPLPTAAPRPAGAHV